MDGIELRCRREYLGLTQGDLAGILGVNPRTIRGWESGEDPIPERIGVELSDLEDEFEESVNYLANLYATAPNKTIMVTHASADDDYPPRWGRHVAARVRRLVPGTRIRTLSGDEVRNGLLNMEAIPAPPEQLALTAAQHTYPWTRLYSQDFARVVWDSDTDAGTKESYLLTSGCERLNVLTIHADGQRETGQIVNQRTRGLVDDSRS